MARQDFKESVLLALNTLAAHKLRSALTVVGVIIGTMTVIAVSSLITGMNKRVTDLVSRFSADVLMVSRFQGGPRFSNMTKEERQRKKLVYEDVVALRDLPAVQYAAPSLFKGSFGPGSSSTVKYRGVEANSPILRATEYSQPYIFNLELEQGRFFTQAEDDHRAAVCVIGADITTALFPTDSPVEKELEIDGKTFRVIGALEKNPASGLFGGSSRDNSFIYIPHNTFQDMYPKNDDYSIVVKALPGQMEKAKDQITELMRRRRKVPPSDPDNFVVLGMDAMFDTFTGVINTIGLIIVPISAFGLLVGGVGVMNIMLVSVTERTKEIGIRRAIGARRRDITIQFLVEAATLTGLGGLLGIIIGVLISLTLNLLLPDLPSAVPLWAVGLGFSVSVGLGLLFGIWPAMRAARLDPVEALRYE